jgi:hypothetical protein
MENQSVIARSAARLGFTLLVLGCLALAGCRSGSDLKGVSFTPEELAKLPNVHRTELAFLPQNDTKSCATTSLAMAITHYEGRDDRPLDKEETWRLSGSDETAVATRGNDIAGLRRIADHYGYESEFCQNLGFDELRGLLARGILAVIFIKLDEEGLRTHAVLVTGYDSGRRVFFVNDPSTGPGDLGSGFLEANWRAWLSEPRIEARRAAFIVYPRHSPPQG